MSDLCTLEGDIKKFLGFEAIRERFIPFSFFVNDEKRKNQLYCLCLKMTADFGNFVAKNDEKRKTKDEMNPAFIT